VWRALLWNTRHKPETEGTAAAAKENDSNEDRAGGAIPWEEAKALCDAIYRQRVLRVLERGLPFAHGTKAMKRFATSGWRVLDYSGAVRGIPPILFTIPTVTHLDLSRARDRSGRNFRCLPEGIGELKALTSLSLCHCANLTSLPDSMMGLSALRHLSLYRCADLRALPPKIGEELGHLESLNLAGCGNLVQHTHPPAAAW